MKIQTPFRFSVVTALLISVLSCVSLSLIQFLLGKEVEWTEVLLLGGVMLLGGGGVVYYLLETLITSKIRLIYRIIHSNDIAKKQAKVNMREDVLGETEREVLKWGVQKREEIEKLKEQEAFRREFLGNLAHELKTPIFSIQGYILTLLEGGLEDEKMNRIFLERANKGVDRITKVVEDLDLITKIESGRIPLNIQRTDIAQLAQEVLDSFEIKAKKHNVTLTLEKENNEMFVLCDNDKIEQVLINLINNSINYGVENGTTTVRLFNAEDHIMIEVADDGIGIGEEDQKRLFERFYRVDKSRARHVGGTGLGLSIVKHIVEAHNSSINVRSTPKKGSVFYFSLKKG